MKAKKPTKIGRPLKLDLGEFERITNEYLEECKRENKMPFLTALAMRLGVDEDTITQYGKREGFASVVKRVKDTTKIWLQEKLSNTDKPLINHIFLAKAIAGLRDNSNLDITSDGKPLGVVLLPKRGK